MSAQLPPGTRLKDRYEIESRLGAGGMGEVYLAQDTQLGRAVALKILPADLVTNGDRVRRFKDEARRASALNHRYIITIYEIGEAELAGQAGVEGTGGLGEGGAAAAVVHFIAMEFINGVTLREKIYRDQPELRKLLEYLAQVAEGLAKAHAAGIVHRDLKPDNIMVTRDGYAKILDFGLAKLVEPHGALGASDSGSSEVATAILPQHSLPGTVMGTVGYMSPEQAQGRVKEIDHRSDIFSFGCILFEAVTRQKAFDGKDAIDSLNKIIREPVAPISNFNPHAPAELQRIVRRCLMKDPDRRYQSIRDVAIELEEIRQALDSEAELDLSMQPASRINRGSTPVGVSRPPQAGVGESSISYGGVGGTGGPAVSTAEGVAARSTTPEVVLPSEPTGMTTASPALKAGRKSYRPALLLGAAALAALAFAAGGYFVGKRVGAQPTPTFRRLTFRDGNILSARFTSDGQTVVYSALWNGSVRQIYSARPESPESRKLDLDSAGLLAVSATGEMAISLNPGGAGATLARVPLAGGAPREVLENIKDADWSPDGSSLAVVHSVGRRDRIEYPVGKVLYESSGSIPLIRVSPKGDLIAFVEIVTPESGNGSVSVVDLGGKRTTLYNGWRMQVGLAWSPSGEEVWFGAPDKAGGTRNIIASTLAGRQRVVASLPGPMSMYDISRDGRVLIARESIRGMVYFGQAQGEAKERELSWLDETSVADMTPDGKTLLLFESAGGGGEGGSIYVRPTDGSPAVRLGDGKPLAISPDGKWVLASRTDAPQQLTVIPTKVGTQRTLKLIGFEKIEGAVWVAGGKLIFIDARERGQDSRIYALDPDDGTTRAVTPAGIRSWLVSADGQYVYAIGNDRKPMSYPTGGGEPKPLPGLNPDERLDVFVTNPTDSFYLAKTEGNSVHIYRVDIATGRRQLWKELTTATGEPGGFFITPDGKFYAYSQRRFLSDLYLVEGLK